MAKRYQCNCAAYKFPHRMGGGKCEQAIDSRYTEYYLNPEGEKRVRFKPLCSFCKLPCIALKVDRGIGRNEYWGSVTVHSEIVEKSDCCGEDVLEPVTAPA